MNKKIVEMRIKFLKQMDDYVNELSDNIWEEWEEEKTKLLYKFISENTGLWNNLCKKFGELTEKVKEED